MVLGKNCTTWQKTKYLLFLPSRPCLEKGEWFVLEGGRDAKGVLFFRLRHTGLLRLRLEQRIRDPLPHHKFAPRTNNCGFPWIGMERPPRKACVQSCRKLRVEQNIEASSSQPASPPSPKQGQMSTEGSNCSCLRKF